MELGLELESKQNCRQIKFDSIHKKKKAKKKNMDASNFLDDIESRKDFVFTRLDRINDDNHLSPKQWIRSIQQHIVEYSFVDAYADYYERHGLHFCQEVDWILDGQQKLEWMTSFVDCDRQLLPSMVTASRQWKEETTLMFYLSIYSVHHQHREHHSSLAVQCGSYILEHGHFFVERFSVQDYHIMVNELLSHMEIHEDWDMYDLLQRTWRNETFLPLEYRFSHAQREVLERFARYHRYVRNQDRATNPQTSVLETNVYTDTQNVHTRGISQSLLQNMKTLHEMYHQKGADHTSISTILQNMEQQLGKRCWKQSHREALNRIRTDPSTFLITESVRLKTIDVLLYVYFYITEQEESLQKELYRRLAEELDEAAGSCISGHVTRLVNVLVGFHPKIQVKIEDKEHAVVAWQRLLQQHMTEVDDEEQWMTDMTRSNSSSNTFTKWIVRHRKQLIQELRQQHFDEPTIHSAWNTLFPSFINMTQPSAWYSLRCLLL